MQFFSLIDSVALIFFVVGWASYSIVLESKRFRSRSIASVMGQYRAKWMRVMAGREVRMLDSQLQASLMQGVGFLASTAVLMVGVLTAMLGFSDSSFDITSHLPQELMVETANWKLKILLVSLVFVFAFFKLLWCYRLFNYCAILIGATGNLEDEDTERHVARISAIHIQAGDHFNAGLRAYYFAVAGLGWLLHPGLLMLMTTLVLLVLWRRDFASRSLAILRGDWDEELLKARKLL